MSDTNLPDPGHSCMFLGKGHERSEKCTWAVIWLCSAMMLIEIVGGLGPGHFGAIVSVETENGRGVEYYPSRLARFGTLSHLTIEVFHPR